MCNIWLCMLVDWLDMHIVDIRWNEWHVRFAHNYTSSFRSILRVLSPFSFWEFINVVPHTALFSCLASQFPTSVWPRDIITLHLRCVLFFVCEFLQAEPDMFPLKLNQCPIIRSEKSRSHNMVSGSMPFQQIIMHVLQCQHDLDVHLLFCVDLDLHITSSRGRM